LSKSWKSKCGQINFRQIALGSFLYWSCCKLISIVKKTFFETI
jgi:hypothetical protein